MSNFSFRKLCMHLISSFTCKDIIFKRISSSCYGIFFSIKLKETNLYEIVLKKSHSKYWRNLQENTRTKIQLQVIKCDLANTSADRRPKICLWKSCIWPSERHMYIFCMFISGLLSSGMKLGVRKFRNLIDFGLHSYLRVEQFYLILHLLETG